MSAVRVLECAVLAAALLWTSTAGGESVPVWRIGVDDNRVDEFSLAPDRSGAFDRDGLFIVGASNEKDDWPYFHPGPLDSLSGSRPHPFRVVFDLADPVPDGTFTLHIDLADTHAYQPPVLSVACGSFRTNLTTRPGGGDNSVRGDLSGANEHRFSIPIPPGILTPGINTFTLTTTAGHWCLYDWVGLEGPAGTTVEPITEGTFVRGFDTPQLLTERDGQRYQPIRLKLRHIGQPLPIILVAGDVRKDCGNLEPGEQTLECEAAAVNEPTTVPLVLLSGEKTILETSAALPVVRPWKVYLLPHSHVDIGYTKVQTEVESDQVRFLYTVLEAIENTADYPEGSRFAWNSEVLWHVDAFLKQASPADRKRFAEAVRGGRLELDGLYGNQLTALCRPEELVQLLAFACNVRKQLDVPLDAAMISDVPGYTWGLIPVLASSGVRYFSIGPNRSDRIGGTLSEWGDRPFYWASPSGQEKVLTWIHGQGYSWFHQGPLRDGERVLSYLHRLSAEQFPYDMVALRYNIGGDNGPPDTELTEFVRTWNEQYVSPRLLISTARAMFQEFESEYGASLPTHAGDFTPYWEDGAASSARETTLNRTAADRIVQAGTLWSLLKPAGYPADRFQEAWRNVLLYDEHTWGAHNSISQPDEPFVLSQWAIKQAFAVDGYKQARHLMDPVLEPIQAPQSEPVTTILVLNTSSWPRTELIEIQDRSLRGLQVVDSRGGKVPSQRTARGWFAFLARNVPPLGSVRYTLVEGEPDAVGSARAEGLVIANDTITVRLDELTGAICELTSNRIPGDFVDSAEGTGLNEYLYVAGKDPAAATGVRSVTVEVVDPGPLVATVRVTSAAPGCRKLMREIRIVDGIDRVEIENRLDKEKVRTKEGVHFAFPFQIPDGVVRLDTPWAVVRVETDQLVGSCKNWFTVQRWVDVSNQTKGITWITPDAPLVELGAITAEIPWIKTLEPTQRIYSYVMNNYWHTNYKADQEGETAFRYVLYPHGPRDQAQCARWGMESSQPLLPVPCSPDQTEIQSPMQIVSEGVVLESMQPMEGGRQLALRFFNPSAAPASLGVNDRKGKSIPAWRINLAGDPLRQFVPGEGVLPGEMLTLKVAARGVTAIKP